MGNLLTFTSNVRKWWFWLDPVQLEKTGGFKPQELNRIGKLVQENQHYLMERWHEHFGH